MRGIPEAMFSGEFVRRVAATLLSSLGRGPAGFYTIAQFQFQIPAKEQKKHPPFSKKGQDLEGNVSYREHIQAVVIEYIKPRFFTRYPLPHLRHRTFLRIVRPPRAETAKGGHHVQHSEEMRQRSLQLHSP